MPARTINGWDDLPTHIKQRIMAHLLELLLFNPNTSIHALTQVSYGFGQDLIVPLSKIIADTKAAPASNVREQGFPSPAMNDDSIAMVSCYAARRTLIKRAFRLPRQMAADKTLATKETGAGNAGDVDIDNASICAVNGDDDSDCSETYID